MITDKQREEFKKWSDELQLLSDEDKVAEGESWMAAALRILDDKPTEEKDGLSKEIILTHQERGVYLGNCLGLGFWSKWEAAGQTSACTFEDENAARKHVDSWDAPPEGKKDSPDEFQYIEVDVAEEGYATMEECVAAGAEPWEIERCGG